MVHGTCTVRVPYLLKNGYNIINLNRYGTDGDRSYRVQSANLEAETYEDAFYWDPGTPVQYGATNPLVDSIDFTCQDRF